MVVQMTFYLSESLSRNTNLAIGGFEGKEGRLDIRYVGISQLRQRFCYAILSSIGLVKTRG